MVKLSKKKCFKAQLTLEFLRISRPTSPPSVTLVTAKNQHRCWKARTYACARESLLTLDTLYRKNACFAMRVCHFTYIAKKKVQISAIFSLFWAISTHIHIGTQKKQSLPFISTFTAEATPIYPTLPPITAGSCYNRGSRTSTIVAVSYKLGLRPFQNIRWLIISDLRIAFSQNTQKFPKNKFVIKVGVVTTK